MDIKKENIIKKQMVVNYFPNTGGQDTYRSPIYIFNKNFFVGKTSDEGIDLSLTGIITADNIVFAKVPKTSELDSIYWKAENVDEGRYEGHYGVHEPLRILSIQRQRVAIDIGKFLKQN